MLTNPSNFDNMYHDHPQSTYDDMQALNAIFEFLMPSYIVLATNGVHKSFVPLLLTLVRQFHVNDRYTQNPLKYLMAYIH